MGLSMSPAFGITTTGLRGFAGEHKSDVSLVFQKMPQATRDLPFNKAKKHEYYLTIVNDRNKHITSYGITEVKLKNIAKDGFWVLKKRDFN